MLVEQTQRQREHRGREGENVGAAHGEREREGTKLSVRFGPWLGLASILGKPKCQGEQTTHKQNVSIRAACLHKGLGIRHQHCSAFSWRHDATYSNLFSRSTSFAINSPSVDCSVRNIKMHETLRDLLGILFLPTECCTSIIFYIFQYTDGIQMYIRCNMYLHILYLFIDKEDKETHRYIYYKWIINE
jgi:hypothetical protein